jgi:hypothetical protein
MFIDDGDAFERRVAPHQTPFLAEHIDESLLDFLGCLLFPWPSATGY